MPDDMQDDMLTPRERAALSAALDQVPERDWASLESRIVDAARVRLAGRRNSRSWRAPATRWARVLIPAALAASVLLGVGLALDGADTTDGPAVEDVVAVAASSGLPSDPLSVTDQPAFLASVLAQEPAP